MSRNRFLFLYLYTWSIFSVESFVCLCDSQTIYLVQADPYSTGVIRVIGCQYALPSNTCHAPQRPIIH